MKQFVAIVFFTALAVTASGQVTITPEDMYTTIGLYYRSYSSADPVDVTGVAGTAGGPQLWNFRDGPTDKILISEIVDPDDGGVGGDFPTAQWCERQGEENNDPDTRWYYRLDPSGIINLGIWSPLVSEEQPVLVFSPAVLEYPDPISYGSNWSNSTEFFTTLLYEGTLYDVKIEQVMNYQADAWGTIQLPATSGNCLRIDRQTRYDIYTQIWGIWILLETYHLRSYLWLLEDRGTAAQLVSQESTSPPPEYFNLAYFVRQLETNHPGGVPAPVTDLTATLAATGIQLNWSPAAGAAIYRVEGCASPNFSTEITVLAQVYDNAYLDGDYAGQAARFYRVISLN